MAEPQRDVGAAEQAVHPLHQGGRIEEGVLEAADRLADPHQPVAETIEQGGGFGRNPVGQAVENVATGLEAVAKGGHQIGDRRQQGAPAGELLGAGQFNAAE